MSMMYLSMHGGWDTGVNVERAKGMHEQLSARMSMHGHEREVGIGMNEQV